MRLIFRRKFARFLRGSIVASARLLRAASICGISLVAQAETVVTGLSDDVSANVLSFLDIDNLGCDAGQVEIDRAFARIDAQATEALNAFGFYAASIATSFARTDECWQVDIAIEPGAAVRWRSVDLQLQGPAAETQAFQTVALSAAIAPGDILNHGSYDRLKRRLTDLARDRGYAEARFSESRIDIFPDELAADLVLHFESGPRYRIGEVYLDQDALDADFVNAFHELEPGALYDNRLLTAAFLDLSDSGYFSAVDVRALPADPVTQTIPVQIELSPAPRRLVSYGVGFSTDTGPRLRFGRTIRRFNSRGHQFSFETQLSPVVSELTSRYRMPVGDPRTDWLDFSLGAKREETETSLARSIEAGVRRIADRAGGWSRTQFVNIVIEDFEVASQSGRPHLLIPGVDWGRIRGDDALRPSNGSRLDFELRGASDRVLSDNSFLQATAYVKWIRTLGERNRVLLRGRMGATKENAFAQLPPSVRFFAGGDDSVRGFDFESLGPVDVDGAVIGGPHLFEVSVEYEREIKPRWSLAVFHDAGNAFDDHDLDLRKGAGIGARWRSPLGPVRIDVAWPINDIEHGPRLHVSLGPDL